MKTILQRSAGIVGLLLLLWSHASTAQMRYHFMQMTVIGRVPEVVYFTPAFKGESYVEMERQFTLSKDKAKEQIQRSEGFVIQKLEALSADGWELVTITSQTGGKDETDYVRYLFRKAY